MTFDNTTLRAVMFLSQLLMGGFLMLLWLNNRREHALAVWACSNILVSLTTLWALLPGVPPVLQVIIPAMGFTAFVAGNWIALRIFLGLPTSWHVTAAVVLLQAALISYFTLIEPVQWFRIALSSVTSIAFTFLLCTDAWKGMRQHRYVSLRLMFGIFLGYGLQHVFFLCCAFAYQTSMTAFFASQASLVTTMLLTSVMLFFLSSVCVAVLIPEKLQAQLTRSTSIDPLTGLHNRAEFTARLRAALSEHRTDFTEVGLIIIDLDGFKEINDQNGSYVGDCLLMRVSEAIRAANNDDGLIGRLGADEFAILLHGGMVRQEAQDIANGLIRQLGKPLRAGQQHFHISASMGLAFAEDTTTTTEEILRQADIAMRASKAKARGRFTYFAPSLDAEVAEQNWLKRELRKALAAGDLHVAYQPKYKVGAFGQQRLWGVEALARWTHPERGAISPGKFIPVAERFGLIEELGEWILRQAMEDSHLWPNLTISVNLSPRQFAGGMIAHKVAHMLRSHGMPAENLELEITEGVLLSADDSVLKSLKDLRVQGIKLALDDFGSGYSSLSYLRDYAFDTLKIDRGFVNSLLASPVSRAITQAIISLAHALNLDVVAEGVEKPGQLEMLQAMGCTIIQGFLLGRPVSSAEITALLDAEHAADMANVETA